MAILKLGEATGDFLFQECLLLDKERFERFGVRLSPLEYFLKSWLVSNDIWLLENSARFLIEEALRDDILFLLVRIGVRCTDLVEDCLDIFVFFNHLKGADGSNSTNTVGVVAATHYA